MRRSLSCWIAGAWFWLLPLPAARAQSAAVYLEWQRPPASTCPPASALRREVEEALGRPVFTTRRAAHMRVRGVVEERASGTTVRLEARRLDGRLLGTRELHAQGSDCAELRSDIVLVLTLLVEHDRQLAPPPSAAGTWQSTAGGWLGLIVDSLPRPDLGVGPALTLELASRVELRVDAGYWFPIAIQTAGGIHANLHAASGAVRVCPRVAGGEQRVLDVRLCGGVQLLAWIAAQAGRELQVRLQTQALLELRSGLRLGQHTTIELALGPLLTLSRRSIVAVRSDDSRVVLYRPPLLGVLLSLALLL